MPFIECSHVIPGSTKLNVLIVPNFDLKSLPAKDPREGSDSVVFQSISDATKNFIVKVDLATTTISELKQKLYSITNIPTFEAKFNIIDDSAQVTTDASNSNRTYLLNEIATLSSYGIIQNQAIFYKAEKYDYSERTYKPILKRTIEQSADGVKLFHSFLYCFANIIGTSEKPTRESLLGMIRQSSYNNTPLLHAIYELSIGKPMSLLDSIALEEGFLFIASNLVRELGAQDKLTADKFFENILDVVSVLCELAVKPSEEYSRDETYLEYDTICPLSLVELKNPVCLRKIDGTYAYFEEEVVIKRAKENSEIAGIGMIKEDKIKVVHEFVYNVRRAVLNGKDSFIL